MMSQTDAGRKCKDATALPESNCKWISFYRNEHLAINMNEELNSRSKRSVDWSPDYEMYEDWAKDYYDNHVSPIIVLPNNENPRKDIIEKFFELKKNTTTAERMRTSAFVYYILAAVIVLFGICCVGSICCRLIVKCIGSSFYDDNRSRHFLNEMEKLLNNYVPGMYVDENGTSTKYRRTEEEKAAHLHAQRLINKLRIELI